MDKLFRLRWGDYDTERNFFFEGPEMSQEDFQKLCESLMPEVVDEAISMRGRIGGGYTRDQEIGWYIFMDILAFKILPKHGFKLFQPKIAQFNGPGLIFWDDDRGNLSEEVMNKIIQYNKQVENNAKPSPKT